MAVPNPFQPTRRVGSLDRAIGAAGGTTALTLEEKIAAATAMTEARRKAEAEEEASIQDNLEGLDPETAARMDRAVASARSLGGRPLVSGMAARRMGDVGAQQQFAAMSGGRPESQLAATQQGATMGSRILASQAGKMVGEGQERFGLTQRLSRARKGLESGQAVHALSERLKDLAAKKGIQLNDQMAMQQATAAVISMGAQLFGGKKAPTAAPGTGAVTPYSSDYPGFHGF